MSTKIFVNLPVKDLQKTNTFFSGLGFQFNPHFSDDKATCMILNEEAFVMLLLQPFFQGFTDKPIADAHQVAQMLLAVSADTREKVDEMLTKAVALGATEIRGPIDHGFMYQRSFNDLDGHIWEVFWMDPNAVPHG